MASGVTFYDYREAREYQNMLLREGTNSNLAIGRGKYTVVPKEKTRITIETAERRELGGYEGEQYGLASGEHLIRIAPKATTKTKVHEVGHAVAGHMYIGGITTGERIERELDAEIYAWQQLGKEPNHRVGLGVIRETFRTRYSQGKLTGEQAVSLINEVARRMGRRGISVTVEGKKELLSLAFQKTDDPEIEEWKEKLKEQF